MRNLFAFLLCLIMLISLVSCDTANKNKDTDNDTVNTESSEKDDGTTASSISNTNKQYYKIEKKVLTKVRYYIYDSDGNTVLSDETDRPLDISMLGDNIVDICIGMGTGISVHKYYDVQNNRFSEEYTYVAASSGNLVAYIDGDSMQDRRLIVRDIFNKNIFYKSFELDFSQTVYPIESASFTDGEAELDIVYLSERSAVSLSMTLPIRRASGEGEILSQAEKAIQRYESFLRNEIAMGGSSTYLKNCREEYLMNYLWERNGGIDYAYVDMDGNGQAELLVRGIDTLVFSYSHENNEVTYINTHDFHEMNRVYTDGSYSWTWGGGADGVTYGIKKNGEDIWRIENEGGENPLYYIGNTAVTEEELRTYVDENPTPEEVQFTNVCEGWNKVIDKERAEEIASEYWNIKDGDINEHTGKEYIISVSGMAEEKYYVKLYSGYSYYEPYIDSLYIDAITGKILTDFSPGDKG